MSSGSHAARADERPDAKTLGADLGWVLGIMALTGFLGSLAGFVAAIVAKVRHERRTPLWLPLSVFPALLAFLVFGEAFWWE